MVERGSNGRIMAVLAGRKDGLSCRKDKVCQVYWGRKVDFKSAVISGK